MDALLISTTAINLSLQQVDEHDGSALNNT